ncbi:MAG: signal peptide peptidase SppA [Sideroxydans sp.]
MKILDVLTSPWAIQPSKLLEIQGIYATHLRGQKIDLKGVEAAIGRPLNNQSQGYEVIDGVAVLPITGVISKRMNLFAQISGGVSTELVARDLKAAINDPAVKAIILQIDSPGGTVDGTETLANLVREARATKPTVAFADGMMASAAYWIGSAASEIYISDSVAQIGSIGVVATHQDISAAEAARGVKTTEITAGKFKRAASQFAPLTESGRQTIQDQVDTIYSVFVQTVADNRGVSVETVLENMADGRVFIGQQAVDAGLVDGVSTLDALIAKLSQQGAGALVSARKTAAITQPAIAAESLTTQGEYPMGITKEQLLADAPDVAKALIAEGSATGATAERERIQSVMAQAMPGHEALINSLAFDGKTTGPEAAVAVLGAERSLRDKALGDRRADAPAAVPHAAAPSDAAKPAAAEDASLPFEERAKAKWDASAELRTEFGAYETYLAYAKAHDAGTVKVLSK